MHSPRDNARHLRKKQTDAERRLWQLLRNRSLAGCKFRRQHPVGPYICDFVCFERRLVIEVDGGQHTNRIGKDEARSAYLRSQEFTIVRFWNHEVLVETEAVVEKIRRIVSLEPPHPVPLPKGARGR